jgi:hypothetical protein
MNNQYLQWLSGPKRGEVETAEMMQDGQTFEDVVIVSGGGKIPMSKIGKDFIILPAANAALSQIDLDVMYPKPNPKQNRRADQKQRRQEAPAVQTDHVSILGFDPSNDSPSEPRVQERQRPKKHSSFATDLLTRAKKNDTKITLELQVEMPSSAFFSMMNETFEESTVNEVIDIIIDSIDQEALRNSMKQSIIKFYGGQK